MNWKQMNKNWKYILPIAFILTSCSIDTASAPKDKVLVIASDYLFEKDTLLFSSFVKEQKVAIKILHISTDKIIGNIRNTGSNSGIDVVMVKSVYDIFKLNKRDILHNIRLDELDSKEKIKYSSATYNYFAFGIDPYVVFNANVNPFKVKTYNDLTNHQFLNELEEREITPFLSPVMHKMKRVQANNWMKKFLNNSRKISESTDSMKLYAPILTTLSCYHQRLKSDTIYFNRSISYPNKKSTGSFYNLRTFGIIKQAENYMSAKNFISFCLTSKNNSVINSKIGTISIHPSKNDFRKYSTSIEKLIEQYILVDRVVRKFD